MRLLFICARNQWRSPTAEKIFARHPGITTRSRGLAKFARRKLRLVDLQWADHICVMEDRHYDHLLELFADSLPDTPIHVLDIPDHYRFMDPELISLLQGALSPILTAALPQSSPPKT